MAVALRAHLPLPDRRRPHAPGRGGIGVRPEDGDLARLEPPRRRVWYAVNPASPEPTTATRAIYFTEPASRPWTK